MSDMSLVPTGAKGRAVYLDYLRVMSALFVITIHVTDSLLENCAPRSGEYIYAGIIQAVVRMGVPLFFMISGALLLSRPVTVTFDWYATRLTRLLVPLTVYSIFYTGATAQNSLLTLIGWAEFFRRVIAGDVFYHLWFVYTLAGIYLLVPLLSLALSKAPRSAIASSAVALISFHCVETYAPHFGVKIGLDFSLVGTWFVYFVMGYALSLFSFEGCQKRLVILAAAMVALTAAIRLSNSQLNPFDKGLNLYLSSAAVFAFARALDPFLHSHPRLNKALASLSARSYGVYLIHAFFLNTILAEHYMVAAHTMRSPYLGVPLMVIFTLAFSLPMAWVVDRFVADPLTILVSNSMLKAKELSVSLWLRL